MSLPSSSSLPISMSNPRRRLVLPFLACSSALALAQAPPLDLSLDPSFTDPTVNIQEHENRTTEEFRVNGNLYMVKVTPAVGPAYYLVDPDGSGEFEWRRNTPGADLNVPQWALVRW